MGFGFKKKEVPSFTSRSEAFDYLFADLVENGRDMMEAAEQASKFADIVAKNKQLPDTPPKQLNGLEKGIGYMKQLATLKKENPEIVERIRIERECLNVIAQNKEITDENIAKKYNTNMTADENAINIGISPSRVRMWKRDNPDKVETIEQKILRLYNPELGWRKNAEIIGYSWLTIKKYVKKNKQTAKSAAY
jgi:hypothetical protein